MNQDIKYLFQAQNRQRGNFISVILPVYNEVLSLPFVLDELYAYLSKHQKEYKFEITFIDDCSTDDSFSKVRELAKNAPENVRVSVARLAKNSGSHVAITAGLNIARGNFIIIMSSDGQDPATVIGDLISEWKQGNDLVLATRSDNLENNRVVNYISNVAWRIMKWSTDIKMPDHGCDLLGMDKKVLGAFNRMDERNTTFIFRILSLGFDQKEIRYVKRARVAGKSKWTFFKKIAILFDAMTGFSNRPLKMITSLGMTIFVILVFRWLVVMFKVYVMGEQPDSQDIILNSIFTSLAVVVLLLGFIGDYIWRILDETRKRPLYEVSKVGGEIFEDDHGNQN